MALVVVAGCKKPASPEAAPAPKPPAAAPAPEAKATHLVGLVTDVGGRGDQSFNDSALRGLETWAAGASFKNGSYAPLSDAEFQASVPEDLKAQIQKLPASALVLQSKAQEDYQPNLQLLVDQKAELVVGVGFMLENAVEAAAKQNPSSKFLLIDSPILDASGSPQKLPNVRSVVFREEEGSFLVGALAGLVAKKTVGFVGGMNIPLIKKFESGYRAGILTTHADASVLAAYTGSFDNVAAGKQVAQDLLQKGAEVIFHAAGSDGLGVIQAVKEARAAGKNVYAVGVDSDQFHLAPEAMLTSMVKRVDVAVYGSVKDLVTGAFAATDQVLGLKEGGVALAEVRVPLDGKDEKLKRVEALKSAIIAGQLHVPSNEAELKAFKAP